MKMKKMVAIVFVCSLIMGITATAVNITPNFETFNARANWPTFEGRIPKSTADTEISTAEKLYTDNKWAVSVDCLISGLKKVHAWTESERLHINYSSNSNIVNVNDGRYDFYYDKKVPLKNDMVILNLDNVENIDKDYDVAGTWSPW